MRKNIKKAVDDVIKYIDELSYNDISTISEILEITGHLDLSDEHQSKGIYKIKNTYTGKDVYICASDDLEETERKFKSGIMPTNNLNRRYIHRESLVFEIVEITEDINSRYVFYFWPQLERVHYSKELVDRALEPKVSKKVRRVVDWLIAHFSEKIYSFFLLIEGEENNIRAIVYCNGEIYEAYLFCKSAKEPVERGFKICGESN